jgi:XapX domain-containing protein
MKILAGAFIAFLVGAGCRYFDIPVPSPPVLPGAFLVVAMTLGYSVVDHTLARTARSASAIHNSGAPSGTTRVLTKHPRTMTISKGGHK